MQSCKIRIQMFVYVTRGVFNYLIVFYVLYCIVLYCIVLYCIVLCCVVLCCVALYCIVLCCIVLYCIVLFFWWGGHCYPMHCDLFKIYCAPPNLGIRTWIWRLNFAQRPIFSGFRFFNEPEISDSGSPA